MIKIKCFYHDDLDGQCSAAIVAQALGPDIEFQPINYNDVDCLIGETGYQLIYFVDFTPRTDLLDALAKNNTGIIILDHHKTAFEHIDEIKALGHENIRMIFDLAFAGCGVVWKYFFPEEPMPLAARLTQDFDIWKWEIKETGDFVAAMKIEDVNSQKYWLTLFADEAKVEQLIVQGKTINAYERIYYARTLKNNAFEAEFEGYRILVCDCPGANSKLFGDRFKDYPFVMKYEFDGHDYMVSLYSYCPDGKTPIVDVSEIAKKYGGGGHAAAAGFTCKELV